MRVNRRLLAWSRRRGSGLLLRQVLERQKQPEATPHHACQEVGPMTTTREQLDAARTWLKRVAEYPSALPGAITYARTLLAATAEPSEEELDAEAERAYPGTLAPSLLARGAYIRGARREGRMAKSEPPMKRQTCHARDGECLWDECPQKTDEQPICVLAHRGGRR